MQHDQAIGADRWVDQHGDSLYRYALARLRSADLAADVVQETFLEALRAQGSFEGRSSERTWLIGILRHKILDQYRTLGREEARSSSASLEPGFDRRGHWKLVPESWAEEPSLAMETREFWDVFHGCLSKLPSGLADAFFLREVDGLGAEEVQRLLGISPANLWARLYRARTQLRRCLEIGWFGRQPRGARERVRNGKGRSPPMYRLKSIWRLLNLPCLEMTRLASESLDRDLDRWERIALDLLYCRGCRRYTRQIVRLRRALRQVLTQIETERVLPDTSLPADVRARIKRALRES